MERVSQRLATRIKELTERYENPLHSIEKNVKELEDKVNKHLNKMGFKLGEVE